MSVASLELSGISKRYPGVQALDRVSFACLPGEIHAVLGENGSGKSTLLGIAGGAVAADEGTVTIMGKTLTAADPQLARRLGLATVYQDDSLVRELTVAENLVLGAVDGRSVAGAREWAAAQLAPYDLGIAPDAIVGSLSPAQRQFLEIVKALVNGPKVLLLDEPTSSLDISGVEKLSAIVREIARAGTAIVYVSHRLPEILALAQRVTILRDGKGQGTYEVDENLSESDLVDLMVGRPIAAEYPEGEGRAAGGVALSVKGLTGHRFRDISFEVAKGEILGFAGAEGNGQRETLRALGGIEESSGTIERDGRPIRVASPGEAMRQGILSLSGDRSAESIFPSLGVRENMTVSVLGRFAQGGLVSAARERARAIELVERLNIVTASLDKPIAGLSGGNQQKAVLARSFLDDAAIVLIDEPTQGVDANARFDIYRAIREKADQGVACIVNSSDAMELAGICDRVLVFSRGQVTRELKGQEITEETIVSAFLRSKQSATAARADRVADEGPAWLSLDGLQRFVGGSNQWRAPLLLLLALIVAMSGYAASQSDVFLSKLNIRHILLANAPLALVTMAQFNVLMVRGFDISVGSVMSLTVVIASFLIGDEMGTPALILGAIACLAAGLVVGLVNAGLIRRVGINSVITTIATLSIVQGIALYLRPTPLGTISDDFIDLLQTRLGFAPLSFFLMLAVAILGDVWLYRSRGGLAVRAVGFREEAAKRNGVRIEFVHLRAYVVSALIAVVAGYFLASEVGVGHPVIGAGYTLSSIAAAVLGGAALTGGRGSFVGALLGALFFTLTLNVITLVGLSTGAGIITSGALTLFAVFVYSGWQPVKELWASLTGFLRQRPAPVKGAMSLPLEAPTAKAPAPPRRSDRAPLPVRFLAIWLALVCLLVVGAIIVPRSLLPSTVQAIIPLAAFLAISAVGQALVLMARGIDLSTPAIVTLSSTILLGVSRGQEDGLTVAIVAALAWATGIGLVNGLLVAVLRLNALIVTLAVGAIVSGATLWYRDSLAAEARVPASLAEWGDARFLGFNASVWVAAALVVVLTILLRKTVLGRHFIAVGANPRAAWIAGINVRLYQAASFTVAGLLYGVVGILLSAFIRNPTLKVGDPYLLAPIAAAVLGGTAISGGIGSMVAVAGAALFLTQLDQMMKMLGLSSALQFVIQGAAIALGMTVAQANLARYLARVTKRTPAE